MLVLLVPKKTAGRPKGAKNKKAQEPEELILTPKTQEAFMKLRRGQRTHAPIHAAKRKSEKDRKKALLKMKLQTRYFHEFQAVDFNAAGSILEHPKYKFLGRILQIKQGMTGDRIHEIYFPEQHTEEFRARKIKRFRKYCERKGITAHDLRRGVLGKATEEEIKEIFG